MSENRKSKNPSKNGKTRNLIASLDIGTSKISVLVGEITQEGTLKIIGVGMHKSAGMKNGIVVNSDAAVSAIIGALSEAELMADCMIREVYTGVTGRHITSRHITSQNSSGMIKSREISQDDIDHVIETTCSINLPIDQMALPILEPEFRIDGQEGFKNPLCLSCMCLEVEVLIVTGAVAAVQNIMKCVHRCGVEVSKMILHPLASSKAVLSDDEKDLGVCMVDIGGGTTDVAIFSDGMIRHIAVIPIAGNQITKDIAIALHIPTKDAENIKIKYGCALRQLADDEPIEVPGSGEHEVRMLSRQLLAKAVEPRVEELYSLVQAELRRSGFEDLLSFGIVITGGSSVMQGMVEMGEEIFHLPVRLGLPRYVGKLSDKVNTPQFSTGIGLLLYGLEQHQSKVVANSSPTVVSPRCAKSAPSKL